LQYCNELLFRSTHWIRSRRALNGKDALIPAIFMHLPNTTEARLEDDVMFARSLAERLLLAVEAASVDGAKDGMVTMATGWYVATVVLVAGVFATVGAASASACRLRLSTQHTGVGEMDGAYSEGGTNTDMDAGEGGCCCGDRGGWCARLCPWCAGSSGFRDHMEMDLGIGMGEEDDDDLPESSRGSVNRMHSGGHSSSSSRTRGVVVMRAPAGTHRVRRGSGRSGHTSATQAMTEDDGASQSSAGWAAAGLVSEGSDSASNRSRPIALGGARRTPMFGAHGEAPVSAGSARRPLLEGVI
jgi:hypothetical protein